MNSKVKKHLLDIENYYFDSEWKSWKTLSDGETKLREHSKERIKWAYKEFPRTANPRNNFVESIFYYILHQIGALIPFLNFGRYEKFFNLIFIEVKMNAVARYETKKIENYKRDRRYKSGYRDESIRWRTKVILPHAETPYWNLTKAEIKRNRSWAIYIGIGYMIFNILLLAINKYILLGNLICMGIGLIMSYIYKSRNKLGKSFYESKKMVSLN